MTLDYFWTIIEKVHLASNGEMDKKCELLEAELRQLPLNEVRAFCECFEACLNRACSHELWAAAFIIGGGCSDDAF